jgi:hypothetical protein
MRVIAAKRTFFAVATSILLVAAAVTAVWLMASAGVFRPSEGQLLPAPGSGPVIAAPGSPVLPAGPQQVSQPRDPFRPLLLPPPTTTTIPDDTTTTTTLPDDTTTTTIPGETTTTTTQPTDSPDGILVLLREIRTEQGVLVAVVEVDDVSYTVGVGDTFATHFKVVSLDANGGVFTFGTSAFTLAVGQSILK